MTHYELIMFLAGMAIGMSLCVWYYEPKLHRSSTSHQSQESGSLPAEAHRFPVSASYGEARIPSTLFDDDPFSDGYKKPAAAKSPEDEGW